MFFRYTHKSQMVSKTLVLLGLLAFLLVVSEMAAASRTQSDMVKSKDEIVKPNQQSYGGNGPISYGGGGGNSGGLRCYRCCVRGRYNVCLRCCAHAEEVVQTQPGH